MRAGNLAVGWRKAEALIPAFAAAGNVNLLRQAYQTRAEILLAVTGLIDPHAEAPPERPVQSRSRPTLADVATFLRLRLTGKRIARRELEIANAMDPEQAGIQFARCEIGLGLIALARKDRTAARAHLERGLREAEAEQVAVLVARARSGLARL